MDMHGMYSWGAVLKDDVNSLPFLDPLLQISTVNPRLPFLGGGRSSPTLATLREQRWGHGHRQGPVLLSPGVQRHVLEKRNKDKSNGRFRDDART